jgi:hypothetical protein
MREEDMQDDRIITTLEHTGAEQRRNKQCYRLTTTINTKKNKKKENYQTNKQKQKKLQIDYPIKKIPQRSTNL